MNNFCNLHALSQDLVDCDRSINATFLELRHSCSYTLRFDQVQSFLLKDAVYSLYCTNSGQGQEYIHVIRKRREYRMHSLLCARCFWEVTYQEFKHWPMRAHDSNDSVCPEGNKKWMETSIKNNCIKLKGEVGMALQKQGIVGILRHMWNLYFFSLKYHYLKRSRDETHTHFSYCPCSYTFLYHHPYFTLQLYTIVLCLYTV